LSYKLFPSVFLGLQFGLVDGVKKFNTGLQWKANNGVFAVKSEGKAEVITASYALTPIPKLTVASAFSFDATTKAKSLALGLKKDYDNNSTVNLLFRTSKEADNDVSIKYSYLVNKYSSLALSSVHNLKNAGAFPRIGFQFALGDIED
jgi:hypothetical protein